MNEPLVSVVMVVCNVERFLAEAIESILGQTFKDFEFIIVDFGSTDKSKAIAASYAAKDSRIRFREIPNCVLPAARNAGCSLAEGRYIAVMDADDICLPDRLRLEVEFMEEHPEVGVMGGAALFVDPIGRPLDLHAHGSEDQEIRSAMADHCSIWHPTVLLRKAAYTQVGGYRTPFVFAHDYDLELRIADHFKCANLSHVVLNYRIHPNQVSLSRQRQQTLCRLAAQASARLRKEGGPDPLDGVQEITPALLRRLGVSEAAEQTALVRDCRNWVCQMSRAGQFSVALNAAAEMLHSSDCEHADEREVSELWLAVASAHRKQRAFLSSFLALGNGVMTRPAVAGRPFKRLLQRLGLISPQRQGMVATMPRLRAIGHERDKLKCL